MEEVLAHQRRTVPAEGLTRESLETLLDLVEIRLGHAEIYDREDERELRQLQRTRDQLTGMLGLPPPPGLPLARRSMRAMRAA
jgi:hypothetical protein